MDFFFKLVWVIIILSFVMMPIGTVFQAATEAKIYNQKYNTHYTATDFLFAKDTILNYTEDGKKQTLNVKIKEL